MKRHIKFFKLACLVFAAAVILTGCGLKQGNTEAVNELTGQITLKYWRVFDGSDAFDDIILAYKKLHPNVNIEYKKFRFEEYENALTEAWAEDRGPDIFTVHNTWVRKYAAKILPLPEKIELPYIISRNKRTNDIEEADYREIKTLTPLEVRNNFAEVVYRDVLLDNQVMGLPLSVDSLALFYNRTILDNAQITKVPDTWLEIKEAVKKLTLQDSEGNIIQSGVALGAADNINRSTDILSLLMMQNGTEMTDASGREVLFHKPSQYSSDKSYRPGMEALRFYTDFAMPSKEVYTWNEDMPEASEAFTQGKLAMMLGYSYQLPLIKTQGGKINIGVAEIPHINADGTDALGNKVNFASYWVETVSKKTAYENYAWDFLMFVADDEQAVSYLKKTSKPTALRSLIQAQLDDAAVKPFASQVLTAGSWYHGRNAAVAEDVLKSMIHLVTEGKNTAAEAIEYAAGRITATF